MKENTIIDTFWLIVKYILSASVIALIIRGFVLIPVPVEGNSMSNTLIQGDFVLMEKFTSIKRFDIIVFQMNDGTTYIKRVIGLPGDTISYRENQLYVNDEPVHEEFLQANLAEDHEAIPFTNDFEFYELMGVKKLGKGSYFVLGDNRRVSKDSRSFGSISEENIIGKARLIFYPFWRIRLI
ncbi:signal peptidase I [Enterococcus lemanii]|uniref:Signal peptidase I n=1 Tax=Enterococcus lemanii TaxID=1159752 RepID=A0ABV9MXG3_9ENTE|nr:signal peptidase I [Enterococcus lemanii]MBM7709969.1 signal peptidase I [Enterococcus lemanii]